MLSAMPAPAAAPGMQSAGMDSTSSSLESISSSPTLTPCQIMQLSSLADDEKEHLLDALRQAEAEGDSLTPAEASKALKEHMYCKRVVMDIDAAGDGLLTSEKIAAATHLPEDEREHLEDFLERRDALGAPITLDEAHEALEEHREVRRIVQGLDSDADGLIRMADIASPKVAMPDDARQHLLETCARATSRGAQGVSLEEAHAALEEHREVVAIILAIESGEGRLTEHNIAAADGISEDERLHLLETLSAAKAAGVELTCDRAHKALELHREVIAIVTAVDPGGDGLISVHNLQAADLSAPVRACLLKAVETLAAQGRKLTSDAAHRVLERTHALWSEDQKR
mmetsp:Transcript_26169/g.87640  ORF Transcript_26169/g.87640 Transcript_26169/m.87640 type:complete len:343 (+) Transcript_26169:82-1110(+)